MGKTKEEYIELCQVEMTRAFYEANQELLKPPDCKLKAAYAVNKSLEKHPDRQILLDEFLEAKNRLNEWEYEYRYKIEFENE